jgi:hypothetical protein
MRTAQVCFDLELDDDGRWRADTGIELPADLNRYVPAGSSLRVVMEMCWSTVPGEPDDLTVTRVWFGSFELGKAQVRLLEEAWSDPIDHAIRNGSFRDV